MLTAAEEIRFLNYFTDDALEIMFPGLTQAGIDRIRSEIEAPSNGKPIPPEFLAWIEEEME